MRRRDFVTGLVLAGAAPAARARPAARRYRIAVASGSLPAGSWRTFPLWRAMLDELRRLGYVEGGNLTVTAYSAEGHSARYLDLAYEIESSKPDVIASDGSIFTTSLHLSTATIPIVSSMFVPVEWRLVASLAHPGANLTGVSVDPGVELGLKRLQILKEVVPSATRVAFLATPRVGDGFLLHQQFAVREKLGLVLTGAFAREATPPEIDRAFAQLARHPPDALFVSPEPELAVLGRQIVRRTTQARLPAMYTYGDYVRLGGLMAYAPDLAEVGRQMADDVRRILAGAKPGDIPIYQPTTYRLVVNLKTAKALGLAIPRSVLVEAGEVIERSPSALFPSPMFPLAGLDPATHVFAAAAISRRGCPAQGRAREASAGDGWYEARRVRAV